MCWLYGSGVIAAPVVMYDDDEEEEVYDEEEEEEELEYEPYASTEEDITVRLDSIFSRMLRSTDDAARIAMNDTVLELMELELRSADSQGRSFGGVRYMGKISSSDKKVNVYTWNILLSSGFMFYGMVQGPDGELYRLQQPGKPYLPDARRMVRGNQWYGALYYEIVPYKWNGEMVYLLAGWGRYKYGTQFKVLDVMRFTKDGVEFGAPLFEGAYDEMFHRIVLESDREANVTLKYEERRKRFVFDHLSPMRRVGDEVVSFGPDMSFDSYVRKRKQWELKEDIKVKNVKQK